MITKKWFKACSFVLAFIFTFIYVGGQAHSVILSNSVRVVYAVGDVPITPEETEEDTGSAQSDEDTAIQEEGDGTSEVTPPPVADGNEGAGQAGADNSTEPPSEQTPPSIQGNEGETALDASNLETELILEEQLDFIHTKELSVGDKLTPITSEKFEEAFKLEPKEALSEEDYENAYVKTEDNGDGTHTMEIFTLPIRYENEKSEWVEIMRANPHRLKWNSKRTQRTLLLRLSTEIKALNFPQLCRYPMHKKA